MVKITGEIGPHTPAHPMRTFNDAVARRLHTRGWTDAEIERWLQSKHANHDVIAAVLGDAIAHLGLAYADTIDKVIVS